MKKVLVSLFVMFFLLITTNPLHASGDLADGDMPQLDIPKTSKVLADESEVIEIKPEEDAKIRWADDKIIYEGEVNAWMSVLIGIDDESIDIDYFRGDTLRAVVACPDSFVRIFKTEDNGQTWAEAATFYFASGAAREPHIVHGPDSNYHVFCLYEKDENDIYTQARRTTNEAIIPGTSQFLSGDDSVKNYSVCTNRRSFHDYSIFIAYHKGLGGIDQDLIYMLKTGDRGQNWSDPIFVRSGGSGFPDITYGNDSTIYVAFRHRDNDAPGNLDEIWVRRSTDFGSIWQGSVLIETDTFPKMAPQIAAAYDGSGFVWVIWPKYINNQWDLRWAWSQNTGGAFSSAATVNSVVDSNEILPSIGTSDFYNSTDNNPQVSFIRCSDDWAGRLTVRGFYWITAETNWSIDSSYADSGAFPTRPVQTFTAGELPAVAYVGESAENVYFDSWANTSGIEEDNDVTDSNGKIECSLDCSVITGTAALKYTLPKKATVDISLLNILGQKVASLDSGEKESGEHTVSVSAENLSQGIYYIVIETESGQKGLAKAAVLK
ncbi:T9SS type A sorting domain-containing protein [candidate division WOR-3 bacterium]|nr:T9SS type A sorting domain-containing protein [candidate division WOR-3 bacterium]